MVKKILLFSMLAFFSAKAFHVMVYNPKGKKIGTWQPCDSFDLASLKDYNEFENPKLCKSFMSKEDAKSYVKKGCRLYGVLTTTKEGQSVKHMAGFVPSYDATMPHVTLNGKKYYQIVRQPGDPVDVVCPGQL